MNERRTADRRKTTQVKPDRRQDARAVGAKEYAGLMQDLLARELRLRALEEERDGLAQQVKNLSAAIRRVAKI